MRCLSFGVQSQRAIVKREVYIAFARDLREKRDWSEVSSVRVAPVSLTIYERRRKRTAYLNTWLLLHTEGPNE
jgi:hypothetical protein